MFSEWWKFNNLTTLMNNTKIILTPNGWAPYKSRWCKVFPSSDTLMMLFLSSLRKKPEVKNKWNITLHVFINKRWNNREINVVFFYFDAQLWCKRHTFFYWYSNYISSVYIEEFNFDNFISWRNIVNIFSILDFQI